VITSTPDDKQLYKKLRFEYAILDEAHMLKNMTSQRYKNLMKIEVSYSENYSPIFAPQHTLTFKQGQFKE